MRISRQRWMDRLNLRTRLMLYFILLSAIPVLLIGMLTYRICYNGILEMAESSAMSVIDTACTDIENLFHETHTICQQVSEDINMQETMRESFQSLTEQYSADLRGSMQLAYITANKESLFGLYALGGNGGIYKSNSHSHHIQDFTEMEWYRTIIEAPESVWFPAHEWSFVVRTVKERFITVGIPFVDKASGMRNGVILAEIREDAVQSIISRELTMGGEIFILDDQNELVTRSMSASHDTDIVDLSALVQRLALLEPEDIRSGSSNVVPDEEYLLIYRYLEPSGWKIIGAVDKDSVSAPNRIIAWTVASLLVAMVVVAVVAAISLSKSVTKPLRELSMLMEQVKGGELSVRMQVTRRDEVGLLGESFNHMLTEMQALVTQIYEEQRKIRNAELKALQSQITPHFLYNSLESIKWLLRLDKMDQATKMLDALSALFTIALSKGNEIISIDEEIQHVSSFLIIESMIYSKKFDYTIEVDKEVGDYSTVKLLLQPLVENSIYHGIKASDNKEFIYVSVREDGDEIVMSVQDTGAGIPPDRLEQLRTDLSGAPGRHPVSKGYGIHNVNERVKLFYGRQYGVDICSEFGNGTEVTIRIPKMKKGRPDV